MCRYKSRVISKRSNEIQVRCKHYIKLCACILFWQNLAHKYSSFQWSFVYKTKSLQVVFQIGEDTLPPIPRTLPVKDREKDGMFWSEWNLLPKDSRSSQINFYIVIIVQALSPVRFDQPPSPRLTTVNQDSQKLLGTQKSCSGVTDEQPVFPESWPASTSCESSSSRSTASHDMESSAHKAKSGSTGTTISSERRNWQVCFNFTTFRLDKQMS